jgi:hypothetical protein
MALSAGPLKRVEMRGKKLQLPFQVMKKHQPISIITLATLLDINKTKTFRRREDF